MSAKRPWSISVTSEPADGELTAAARRGGVRAPLLAALVLALVPIAILAIGQFLPTYPLRVLDSVLLYAMLGMGLNIVIGYAGLLDLGYVAFYAIGAYSYALLAS